MFVVWWSRCSLITSIVKSNLPSNVELHTWSIGFKVRRFVICKYGC